MGGWCPGSVRVMVVVVLSGLRPSDTDPPPYFLGDFFIFLDTARLSVLHTPLFVHKWVLHGLGGGM